MSKEAMKQMVHELEYVIDCINKDKIPFDGDDFHEALRLGRQAIAEAEKQEPMEYPEGDVVGPCICGSWPGGKCLKCPRITPQQRKPLTDDEIAEVAERMEASDPTDSFWRDFARSVEAAHGIKE